MQNLLAYVILKDGVREQFERDIDITKSIKEDLTDIMMSYMMPSKFIYRDSLPLTPNGKIDIKGLINEVNKQMMEFFQQLPHLEPYGNPQYFVYVIAATLPIFIGLFSRNALPGTRYWLVSSLSSPCW